MCAAMTVVRKYIQMPSWPHHKGLTRQLASLPARFQSTMSALHDHVESAVKQLTVLPNETNRSVGFKKDDAVRQF